MKKNSLIFFIAFFLPAFLCAQTQLTQEELNQKYLDANGNGSAPNAEYNEYTVLSLNWNSLTNAMQPFGRSVGGQIGNYVYVFTSQNDGLLAMAYNLTTNTWDSSTVCLDPGYNSGYCVTNNELYKISGTAALTTFEKFTPTGDGTGTWTILASASTNIMAAQNSIVWDGGDYIYAHCSNYSTTAPASYLERYSISNNTWTVLTPVSIIKRYSGLAYHNGFLYLIGGLVPDGQDQTVCMKYETATDTWSPIAPLPEAVNFCKWTTTTANDYIVLVGSGGGYSSYPSSPKVYYYNTSNNTWTYDGDVASERGIALGFYMPSQGKIFFGGGNMGGSSTNYQTTCWTADGGFLPVELISFFASINNNNITLKWSTASEINNSHFEVERSDDGVGFTNIGIVNGAGTTTDMQNYSFVDNEAVSGKYFYRLKQIDFGGSFNFTNIIEAEILSPDKFELSQNYPNPFNPATSIQYAIGNTQFVSLKVYDVLGNEIITLVNEEKPAGSYNVEFDAANLTSGVYYYKLHSASFTETKKMILLR